MKCHPYLFMMVNKMYLFLFSVLTTNSFITSHSLFDINQMASLSYFRLNNADGGNEHNSKAENSVDTGTYEDGSESSGSA